MRCAIYGILLGSAAGLSLILSWRALRRMRGPATRAIAATWGLELLSFTTQSSFEGSVLRPLLYGLLGWAVALTLAAERENVASLMPSMQSEPPLADVRRSMSR